MNSLCCYHTCSQLGPLGKEKGLQRLIGKREEGKGKKGRWEKGKGKEKKKGKQEGAGMGHARARWFGMCRVGEGGIWDAVIVRTPTSLGVIKMKIISRQIKSLRRFGWWRQHFDTLPDMYMYMRIYRGEFVGGAVGTGVGTGEIRFLSRWSNRLDWILPDYMICLLPSLWSFIWYAEIQPPDPHLYFFRCWWFHFPDENVQSS